MYKYWYYNVKPSAQYGARACIAFALMLIATQSNTRIDSNSIFTLLCVVFLGLVTKNSPKIANIFSVSHARHNITQALVSYSEPGLMLAIRLVNISL